MPDGVSVWRMACLMAARWRFMSRLFSVSGANRIVQIRAIMHISTQFSGSSRYLREYLINIPVDSNSWDQKVGKPCWNYRTIYGGCGNRVWIGLPYRPARLLRMASRYVNSVPARFLVPIDCSRIPGQFYTKGNTKRTWASNHLRLFIIARVVDPDLQTDPHGSALILVAGSGPVPGGQKCPHKNRKK